MNARAVIASFSLAALLSGCATLPTIRPEDTHLSGWVESQEPPPEDVRGVEVTTKAGDTVVFESPYVFADHYSGWTFSKGRRKLIGIPMDSIVKYRYSRTTPDFNRCELSKGERFLCGLGAVAGSFAAEVVLPSLVGGVLGTVAEVSGLPGGK